MHCSSSAHFHLPQEGRHKKSLHLTIMFERKKMKIHDLIVVIFISTALAGMSPAYAATPVTVYKSPTCGCCNKYVDYLRDNGFAVEAVNESDMSAVKKRYGMSHVASCHTTLIKGYAIEGHVPVGAIRKLFKEKP